MSQPETSDIVAANREKERLPLWINVLAHLTLLLLIYDFWVTHPAIFYGHDTQLIILNRICMVAVTTVMIPGLWIRKPWGWIGTVILFTTRATLFTGVFAFVVSIFIRKYEDLQLSGDVGLGWAITGLLGLVIGLYGGTAVALFRNRTAFGIDARRGWTVLIRYGWPMWLLAGGVQIFLSAWEFGMLRMIRNPFGP